MAVVTLYQPVPFEQVLNGGPDIELDVLSYSATRITFGGAPGSSARVEFFGQFSFTPTGFLTSGTLAGYTVYDAGIKTFEVTGLRVDMDALFDVAETGTEDQLGALLFGGADRFTGSSGDDELRSYGSNDTVDGGAGNDTLDGGAGNDTILGGAGDDSIEGSTGNDTLDGGSGWDSASGGAGSDTYVLRFQSEIIIETDPSPSGGRDLVQLYDFSRFTLPDNFENAQVIEGSGISLTGNDLDNHITGGSHGDTLSPEAGNDTAIGGDGNDTLLGSAGADTLIGGGGDDRYTVYDTSGDAVVESADGGVDSVESFISYTLPSDVEQLTLRVQPGASNGINGTGNNLDNTLSGTDTSNRLDGGGGDDTLVAANGSDTLLGGAGNDILDGGSGTVLAAGGDGDDHLFGRSSRTTMEGGAGDDVYILLTNNPKVVESAGGGSDSISVSLAAYTLPAEVENLSLGGASVRATGNALANSISVDAGNNWMWGGAGNDTLTCNTQFSNGILVLSNDTLDGGTGDDWLRGGPGNDLYVVDSSGDRIDDRIDGSESPVDEIDSVNASVSWTLGSHLENLTLTGSAAISGTGNALGNTINGNAGANTLTGDAGNDKLSGGDGNDTLSGGSGNDSLNGGSGNDSLVGGTGNDTYTVDNAADVVKETSTLATDIDSVSSSVAWTLGSNLENLTLTGAGSVAGTGNALANIITGNTGNNSLSGSSGNDTLSGGSGNDSLNGGSGNDSLVGGSGNDSYTVDNVADVVSETSTLAAEIDSVVSTVAWTLGSNLEMLTLTGTASVAGTGNALANTITGNTGNNSLAGGAGNDTLSGGSGNDRLDGGTGNDSLVGGVGNDGYTVDSTTDRISETSTLATEIDTVTSSVTWTLGSNLEKLTLTGANPINGTGNSLANTITGNTGNNKLVGGTGNDTLNGGSGNDTLDGGAGNDSLVGGAGNDLYVIDSTSDRISEASTLAAEFDTVTSSVTWTLGGNLEKLTLTGDAAINGTGNALANTITGNTGDNKLVGGTGNDTLSGGAGNDTLDGGAGNDAMVGSTGADVFRFASALSDSPNVDRISDFSVVDDVLQFENGFFTGLTSAGVLSAASFVASTTGNAVDAGDRVLYETDTGKLFYDADGNGAGAKLLVAVLSGTPVLTPLDIFVT